jgi:hypothetical protein
MKNFKQNKRQLILTVTDDFAYQQRMIQQNNRRVTKKEAFQLT